MDKLHARFGTQSRHPGQSVPHPFLEGIPCRLMLNCVFSTFPLRFKGSLFALSRLCFPRHTTGRCVRMHRPLLGAQSAVDAVATGLTSTSASQHWASAADLPTQMLNARMVSSRFFEVFFGVAGFSCFEWAMCQRVGVTVPLSPVS